MFGLIFLGEVHTSLKYALISFYQNFFEIFLFIFNGNSDVYER